MEPLQTYEQAVGRAHLRKFGQYFTPEPIAQFMVRWAIQDGPRKVLDPALGNSVFPEMAHKFGSTAQFDGYEIDEEILKYFPLRSNTQLQFSSFLLSSWATKYDAIIGNPPFLKFQLIPDRELVKAAFLGNSNFQPSGLANSSVLFTLKCMAQLAVGGRMAFLVPPDFLDSKTGAVLREHWVRSRNLEAVVDLDSMGLRIFGDTLTNSCIILVSNTAKEGVEIANPSDATDLENWNPELGFANSTRVPFETLAKEMKWGHLLTEERRAENKTSSGKLGDFVKVRRGLATGANGYFVLRSGQVSAYGLSKRDLLPVITRSADINALVFDTQSHDLLSSVGKPSYLFAPKSPLEPNAMRYVEKGLTDGINTLHLPARKKPWYAPEKTPVAPIWISQASRGRIKVVRNFSEAIHLTTFHGVYPKAEFEKYVDAIWVLMLSTHGQKLLLDASKRMASGLTKLQPGDLMQASFLDLTAAMGVLEELNRFGQHLCADGVDLNDKTQSLIDGATAHAWSAA